MSLYLDIVTPEKKIFSDEVEIVVLPGIEGEMGVLAQHAPLVTTLQPGELHYRHHGKDTYLAVGEGLVEVTQEKIAVLTDLAVGNEEIDEMAVEEAMKRAEKSLEQLTSDEEIAAVQAAIQKSLAQLNLKRRRKRL